MSLSLGVLGLSPENGHPYSWSAIFNGFDSEAMGNCGFPVIPRYLTEREWPRDSIADATVTHVWTQDRALSEQIARAARICRVVDRPEALIGAVDAVLLARDDAENHLDLAAPFLEAGLPIYIDKPIALSLKSLDSLYSLERFPGQIFTCSALRYAKEFQFSADERRSVGGIQHIIATVPKDWDRYAVHVIEPLLTIAGAQGCLSDVQVFRRDGRTTFIARWESGFQATIFSLGALVAPIGLRIAGASGYRDLTFSDTFSAFRSALQDFIDGVRARDVRTNRQFVEQVVDLIERGRT